MPISIGCSQTSVLDTIIEQNEVVIVKFFTPTCVPCKIMEPILNKVLADPKFDTVSMVHFDASEADTGKYRVSGVPSILVFRKGSEIMRQVGACQETVLAQKFNAVL